MSVDDSQLKALIRDLGQVPAAVQRTMRPAILKAGQPVLAQMKSNASWSTRIPGAITMKPAGSFAGVQFRVNSGPAPHARPYEHFGEPGTFRAPLWGNREHWYPHRARPFFYRAVEEKADEVVNVLADAVMQAAEQHGL